MGLDYTDGCVNFRDVGAYINLIIGEEILPHNLIFRGGSIDYIGNVADIESPKSIFNLRNRPDFIGLNSTYYHFPMLNKIEKYDTSQKEVKSWLNKIIRVFESPELEYPVLIHCLSGKDRTGIVVAILLLILGIEREVLIEEYLLSKGEVKREWIVKTIDGLGELPNYFSGIDLKRVRENVLR